MTVIRDAHAHAGGESVRARETWIDVLKGVAIVLVVAQHASNVLVEVGWGSPVVTNAVVALTTFRMPTFFFAAALFFAANFTRSWREVLVSRVAPMLWLYVLWVLIRAAWMSALPWPIDPQADPLAVVTTMFVDPSTTMWFVYALAIYFVVSKASASMPWPIGWAIAIVPSLAVMTGMVSTGNWAWDGIVQWYVFFWLGAHARRTLSAAAPRVRWWHAVGAWVVWVGALGVAFIVFDSRMSPLLPFVALSGVAAMAASSLVVARRFDARALRAIGRHTLPVYLLHVYVLALLAALLQEFTASPASSVAVFAGSVAVAVVVSYGAWWPLRRVPGLFAAPWTRRSRVA